MINNNNDINYDIVADNNNNKSNVYKYSYYYIFGCCCNAHESLSYALSFTDAHTQTQFKRPPLIV